MAKKEVFEQPAYTLAVQTQLLSYLITDKDTYVRCAGIVNPDYFDPKLRPDKRNLTANFSKAGYQSISRRDELLAARSEKLLGTFTRGHLPFSIDRYHNPELAARIPTLPEMATAGLSRFLDGDKPFLLQVEGARIDHAAHLNDIGGLLVDQLAFDDALAAP